MKASKLKDVKINQKMTDKIRKLQKVSKKTKVTIYLDDKILKIAKVQSKKVGLPYQTFINKTLHDALANEKNNRLDKLEKSVEQIIARIGNG